MRIGIEMHRGRGHLRSFRGRDDFIYGLLYSNSTKISSTDQPMFFVLHALDPADGITLSCVDVPLLTIRGHGHITYSTFPIRSTFVT